MTGSTQIKFFVAASTLDGTGPDILRVANAVRTDSAPHIAIGHILLETLCGFPTQAHCPNKTICLPMRNTTKNNRPKMTKHSIFRWWQKSRTREQSEGTFLHRVLSIVHSEKRPCLELDGDPRHAKNILSELGLTFEKA